LRLHGREKRGSHGDPQCGVQEDWVRIRHVEMEGRVIQENENELKDADCAD
jgi:hypothetical protein